MTCLPVCRLLRVCRWLADLVGVQGAASVDTILGPPPAVGWRVITGSLPPAPGELVMLAAPWSGPPWDLPVERLDAGELYPPRWQVVGVHQ
jgi:hypothetical protein